MPIIRVFILTWHNYWGRELENQKKKVKQEDYTGDIIFELWRDALEKSFFFIYIYWRSYWGLKSKVERTFSYIKVTFRTACMLNPDSNRK